MRDENKRALTVFLMIMLIIIIPTLISLLTVRDPGVFKVTSPNPSPFGYTISLLFFIIPACVIASWFYFHKEYSIQRKAFWRTILILFPIGVILDIFLGTLFFNFHNHGSVVGVYLPGFNFKTFSFTLSIPIEEFIFYGFGFLTTLLLYIWSDEYWFKAYNTQDYIKSSRNIKTLFSTHHYSIIFGLILIGAGIVFKKFLSPDKIGFPGYFIFIVIAAVTPIAMFIKAVRSFINWRAFSFTFFIIVLISIIWEATLAIPYGWWGYNYQQMLGIKIGAWHNLPMEATMAWMAVSFLTVITFEIIKVFFAKKES